jgi:hypothetical protein
MSDAESDNNQASDVESETNQQETATQEKPNPKNSEMQNQFQKKAGALQKKKKTRGPQTGQLQKHVDQDDDDESDWPEPQMPARYGKHRMVPVHQSRIADRPYKQTDSAVKIKIELDLEVEVEIYARVKGDVTIGLM